MLTVPQLPSLPLSADTPLYLLVGMGRGWKPLHLPDQGSLMGSPQEGPRKTRYRSSGELLR